MSIKTQELASKVSRLLIQELPKLVKDSNNPQKPKTKAYSVAKKIWIKILPIVNERHSLKICIQEILKKPRNTKAAEYFKVQITEILSMNRDLAKDVYWEIGEIINAGINVEGGVHESNFVVGDNNEFHEHYTINFGKVDKVFIGSNKQLTETKEVEIGFLQPNGLYPTYYWSDKSNIFEIIFNQASKTVNQKWEPQGYNLKKLEKILIREINNLEKQGWQLVETSRLDSFYITKYSSNENLGSAIGRFLGLPTSTVWNYSRIYYGAKFRVRRYID